MGYPRFAVGSSKVLGPTTSWTQSTFGPTGGAVENSVGIIWKEGAHLQYFQDNLYLKLQVILLATTHVLHSVQHVQLKNPSFNPSLCRVHHKTTIWQDAIALSSQMIPECSPKISTRMEQILLFSEIPIHPHKLRHQPHCILTEGPNQL